MIRRIGFLTLALLLSVALVAGLAGCGSKDGSTGESGTGTTPGGSSTGSSGSTVVAAELLTPADVELVSGLVGLEVAPYDPAKGAGGNVNIADGTGQLITMMLVQGLDVWEAWKSDGTTFGAPYQPVVGDESFIGPKDMGAVYIFGFRKGDNAIVIDTFFAAATGNTILSVDQLAELARIVEARLP